MIDDSTIEFFDLYNVKNNTAYESSASATSVMIKHNYTQGMYARYLKLAFGIRLTPIKTFDFPDAPKPYSDLGKITGVSKRQDKISVAGVRFQIQ